MLFNSIEFLFFFLPVVLAVTYLLQHTRKLALVKGWLLAVSLFFYAWWSPVYLSLLLLSIVGNYSLGLMIARADDSSRKLILSIGVIANLGLLGYFKYGNFFVETIEVLSGSSFNFTYIILPLAISFFTFQQITYLVDTAKGLTRPHSFLDYSLFVSFFPQLIAGPIVHHEEMLEQFDKLGQPGDTWRNLGIGASIFTIGLFKKVVIADSFALLSTPTFSLAVLGNPGTLHALDVAAAGLSYAMQLYFDFSGYSDMAIGLACMLGLKLPVNFYSPYRAQNISDFWRMWHATLSRFLRDYVYMPLGGFLCSPWRQRFNLFASMFLGGVWHGAGWTFVLYGVCHGSYMVIHQLWRIKVSGPLGLVNNRAYKSAAQLFTFLVVVLSLVLFRADTLSAASFMYEQLLFSGHWQFSDGFITSAESMRLVSFLSLSGIQPDMTLLVWGAIACGVAACWLLPSTFQMFEHLDVAFNTPPAGRQAVIKVSWQPNLRWAFYIALLLCLSMLNLTENSEFLYFQF